MFLKGYKKWKKQVIFNLYPDRLMEIINLRIPYYVVLKSVYSTLRICRMCCFFVLGHDFAATMDKREKTWKGKI